MKKFIFHNKKKKFITGKLGEDFRRRILTTFNHFNYFNEITLTNFSRIRGNVYTQKN